MHDDVSQRLAAIEIESDQVERSMQSNVSAAKQGFQSIRARIAKLSEDVRQMSHRIRPSIIEDLGLTVAIRTLTEEFGRREGMIATFSSQNVPENVPLEAATALYRISQEALRNITKHAGQTHTRVSLREIPEGIQLQVADFGQGFDQDGARPGLGLLSMEECAAHRSYFAGTVCARRRHQGYGQCTASCVHPNR